MGIFTRRGLFKAIVVAPTVIALSKESGLPLPPVVAPREDPFPAPTPVRGPDDWVASGWYAYTGEEIDITGYGAPFTQTIVGRVIRREES